MLYSCGDDDVQTAIINMYPDFFELPADSLLGKIEQVVTEKSNPTVHRMNFHNLMQENLETVQNYTIRLKSAAKDCEFSCPKCKEDLSDTYITDQFIRRLSNDILQTDILAKADTFKKLGDMIKHAESFEAAVRDQTGLGNPSEMLLDCQHFVATKPVVPSPQPSRITQHRCMSHMLLALLSNVLVLVVVAKPT